MKKIKYFTKSLLIEYNNAAIREKRNRQLKEEFLEELDEDLKYLLVFKMYHKINEVRVQIMFDINTFGFLDMSYERYELLPIITFYDNGSFKLESVEDARKKFPYNGREWVEKTVKTPYRGNQSEFRKKVLYAYDNKCAVCYISEPKILRAAHIIDVAKGGNDTIQNGICLCVNHEIAFDQGILKISPEGEIIVSDSTIHIDKKYINYPSNIKDYPSQLYLKEKFDSLNKKSNE